MQKSLNKQMTSADREDLEFLMDDFNYQVEGYIEGGKIVNNLNLIINEK